MQGIVERPFPSVQLAVINRLKLEFQGALATVGVFPANVTQRVAATGPLARVQSLGGPNDGLSTHQTIDIDLLASSWAAGDLLSRQIEQVMMAYPHSVRSADTAVILDRVVTIMGPTEVPWADESIRRFYASYRVSARR